MFEVIDSAGKRHRVYAVSRSLFLIFRDDLADYGWRYIPMQECVPVAEEKE